MNIIISMEKVVVTALRRRGILKQIIQKIPIKSLNMRYEITQKNLQILEDKLAQINLPITETKIPLMLVEKEDKIQTSLIGPTEIINYM